MVAYGSLCEFMDVDVCTRYEAIDELFLEICGRSLVMDIWSHLVCLMGHIELF